ncbi:hypothetical protein ACEYYB_12595 [Paracoccus sp. p4-l81]|uniref:hypothetical protein n=1 Tax=Paracoccus sp. p4-l81 TaxID=3342806 RepID=UPI0035B86073
MAMAAGGPAVNRSIFSDADVVAVTAVTEVFGRAQKVTGAIVEFAQRVRAASVSADSFSVDGRRVLAARVLADPGADLGAGQEDGRFVTLTLDPADQDAAIFAPGVNQAAQMIVTRVGAVTLASGNSVPPAATGVLNTRVTNRIVDDFLTARFTDPVTGLTLDYNLYIPTMAGPAQTYPLVMFLQDAGVTGSNPRRTLQLGLGAVAFASPEDQARHPAFVLAPQFPVPLANEPGRPRSMSRYCRD